MSPVIFTPFIFKVFAEIVLAVKSPSIFVFPVTCKLPLTVNPVTELNNTLKVPPVLLVYVNVLFK